MARALALAATCIGFTFAACGGGDDESPGEGDAATTPDATVSEKPRESEDAGEGGSVGATGSVVEVSDSEFGTILVDDEGRTLYAFDKETTERSECFGACAEAWPPFYTKGEPQAGKGVDKGLLGTTDHEGKDLVTYDGHPLYYYVDEGPNEVLCQGVDEFGGLWLVVSPQGDPIQ